MGSVVEEFANIIPREYWITGWVRYAWGHILYPNTQGMCCNRTRVVTSCSSGNSHNCANVDFQVTFSLSLPL